MNPILEATLIHVQAGKVINQIAREALQQG